MLSLKKMSIFAQARQPRLGGVLNIGKHRCPGLLENPENFRSKGPVQSSLSPVVCTLNDGMTPGRPAIGIISTGVSRQPILFATGYPVPSDIGCHVGSHFVCLRQCRNEVIN